MKLRKLEPQWLKWESPNRYRCVDTIAEATGILFLCPKCLIANHGDQRGVHSIICWSRSRGTPDDASPGPGRWALVGTGFHDLTLDGESGKTRSVELKSGCRWHGYITNGRTTDA
jgi:hypothetical protein